LQDTIYAQTKQYLSTLSNAEALEVLEDESVKQALGSLYDTLKKEFSS
jgi:hypothetical protein